MNKLYITNKMTAKQVLLTFGFDPKESKETRNIRLDAIMQSGYIRPGIKGFWHPTQKLLKEAFLPDKILFDEKMRRCLQDNDVFTKQELVILFGENEYIVQWMKLNNYLYQTSDCRWRRTDKLDSLLADGVEELKTF